MNSVMRTQLSLVSEELHRFSHGSILCLARDRLKPIPVDGFSEHVKSMHAERDQWFEMEYDVRTIGLDPQCAFHMLYRQ